MIRAAAANVVLLAAAPSSYTTKPHDNMSFSDNNDSDADDVAASGLAAIERYDGEDTSPTTNRELKGWYAYPIAAEVRGFFVGGIFFFGGGAGGIAVVEVVVVVTPWSMYVCMYVFVSSHDCRFSPW